MELVKRAQIGSRSAIPRCFSVGTRGAFARRTDPHLLIAVAGTCVFQLAGVPSRRSSVSRPRPRDLSWEDPSERYAYMWIRYMWIRCLECLALAMKALPTASDPVDCRSGLSSSSKRST